MSESILTKIAKDDYEPIYTTEQGGSFLTGYQFQNNGDKQFIPIDQIMKLQTDKAWKNSPESQQASALEQNPDREKENIQKKIRALQLVGC